MARKSATKLSDYIFASWHWLPLAPIVLLEEILEVGSTTVYSVEQSEFIFMTA